MSVREDAAAPMVSAPEGFAIVGMAARLPGAPDVATFWRRVQTGDDLITRFGPDEAADAFTADERARPDYVCAKAVLDGVEDFDARHFGMYAREAELTDPQARVFLEICWEALEDAGCDPARTDGAIGVWAGCSLSTYFLHHVLADRATTEAFTSNYQVGMYPHLMGALTDTLATRVAYKLDLRGPAITVHTACSTSLTAVAQACESLSSGVTDVALAGGVSITFPQHRGYFAQDGGMASPDGTCRPFDAAANGTVFGHGAGVVVLKRLSDAVADRDQIYAVVTGWGLNNDGSDKISFTAPSAAGQAEAIRLAHASAGVHPSAVGYVECHGTATPMGDPIEFHGLLEAFGSDVAAGTCALGSAKGNLGHLDAAAGVVGLIKAALSVRDGIIPPLAHYASPNPGLVLEGSPFTIPTSLTRWPEDGRRRLAGVSAFGVGGTNVHVLVEEPPIAPPDEQDGVGDAVMLLTLSAASAAQVERQRQELADHLQANPGLPLADVAFTLQSGRRTFAHRWSAPARTAAQAIAALRDVAVQPRKAADPTPPVVFLFPGQGAQVPGMGASLYAAEPEYAAWIDRGLDLLPSGQRSRLRTLLCEPCTNRDKAAGALNQTALAQPALFLTEYALARLWQSRGLVPAAMVGHSVGEFAAAAIAGIISFDDALRLVAVRGQLMQTAAPGAMLSVRAGAGEVTPLLGDGVDIAAINAPKLCTLAGPFEAIGSMEAALAKAGIASRRLHTSHAFHSAMMDGIVEAMRAEAGSMAFANPQIPLVSTVTAQWIGPDAPWNADYAARHCRQCVDFAGALTVAAGEAPPVLLEIGPGQTLLSMARQILGKDGAVRLVPSLPGADQSVDDALAFTRARGDLWAAGVPIPLDTQDRAARRTSLPTYPFVRTRHFIDAPPRSDRAAAPSISEAAPAMTHLSSAATTDRIMTASSDTDLPAAITGALLAILTDVSGEDITDEHTRTSFLELGFDSLFLGQFAQRLERELKVTVTFRQLLGNLPTVEALAAHVTEAIPADVAARFAGSAAPQKPLIAEAPTAPAGPVVAAPAMPAMAAGAGLEQLMQAQVIAMQNLFAQQLGALGRAPVAVAAPAPLQAAAPAVMAAPAPAAAAPEDAPANPRFALANISKKQSTERTEAQTRLLSDLTERYVQRFGASKALAAKYRPVLADPRAAAGFRADWKEMVFPVVAHRAKGARIWDADGNELIDLVNGYGQTAFGHSPEFVCDAVRRQMEDGFPIGPQSPLAGEVAAMIAEMTGHDRVTFCNTGSEAVMAAMRVARAVTGRERVVVFDNDYHGQFDEVLVRGRSRGGDPVALPIAPGIPRSAVGNMTVLKYGDPASLDWIDANRDDIAAVIIEPVQSRHPELRPVEFVRALRERADASPWALVFDEVVTGFRVHPAGMQGVWGIKADMATYGKVLGGGMPVGILAGSSRYMDALDGGAWSYGDDTVPEVSPTFFAGTFVRHPLVLAAVRAVLKHIATHGKALHDDLAVRTAALAEELNAAFAARGLTLRAETYSSWFVLEFGAAHPLGSAIYPLLRLKGLNIQEGFPCYLTTAHAEADFVAIARIITEAVDEMLAAGIFAAPGTVPQTAIPAEPALPDEIPLTEAQTEIWLAAQLGDEASCAFNESVSVDFTGPLDIAALQDALTAVTLRHDALRLRFARSGKTFTIAKDADLTAAQFTVSDEEDPAAALADLMAEDADTAFNLTGGAPVRAMLVKLAPQHHVLVLTAHHIVCDGWSMNIVLEELAALYTARLDGTPADLPPARGFARYALDQATRGQAATAPHEAHWLQTFADVPDLPELPQDRPRAAARTFAGATTTDFVDKALTKAIKTAGARQGATLFTTLFAAMQVMVGRLSGADDVVLGCPTAGQTLVDDPALVGHCVNFLPIRSPFDASASMATHLKATQARVLNAFEHQDVTYGTLVRKLAPPRQPGRLPLTELQFNLERIADGLAFKGLTASVTPNPKARSNFDAFFNISESAAGLRIDVDYNSEIYDEATIRRWLGHYRTLLGAIAEDAETPVARLPLLSAAELEALEAPNATERDYDRTARVFDLIARQIEATPDRIAAVHRDETLTYRALGERVDALASHLVATLPEGPGLVAVAVGRSLTMLVTLLAVWKSGRGYVPLDPRHPVARNAAVLKGAAPLGLVTDDDALASVAGEEMPVIRADRPLPEATGTGAPYPAGPEDTAYVIFTSGSTGTPKGVDVPHRAVVNFLNSMDREPGMTADDTVVAVTTVSFDIAVLELFLPLTVGARVVIADTEAVLDGFGLVALIERMTPTVMQATPTLWGMLLEAGLKPQPGLTILCGGEPLPRDLAHTLARTGRTLFNMYGPTETTIWSSLERVEPDAAAITIGRPIDNTRLHVLDAADAPVPVGVVGELWISGDGLARGYHARPDLTEAAFREIALPGLPPRRLYRTGDVARRLADGTVALLGRRDTQVKLRGFRIELGEVEAALRSVPGVAHAAAAVKVNAAGAAQLVGYLVAAPGADLRLDEVARAVARVVPTAMVPTAWVALPELPRTANGKLNRNALPAPAPRAVAPVASAAPSNDLERTLLEVWREVLGMDEIGTTDNLFTLGADSLTVFRIAARMIDKDLGLEARHLMAHPTITELAAYSASGAARASAPPSLKAFRGGQRRVGVPS